MTRGAVRLLLLYAVVAVLSASPAPTPTSAAGPALHPKTFIDDRTGLSISVQLDPAAPDVGHWKGSFEPDAFAAMWRSRSATLGQVTALHRLSLGSAQVTDQGFWFVEVDYSADISTPSDRSTAAFRAFFIHESSGWKLWTTARS